jgi:hypothetical protein
MSIPLQPGGTWDYKRNTSRVFPVPPDALPNALRALQSFREREPVHAAWIADGYPNMTADEHVAMFGIPYVKARPKRA